MAGVISDELLELKLRISAGICVCTTDPWELVDDAGVPSVGSNALGLDGNQFEIAWGHCMQGTLLIPLSLVRQLWKPINCSVWRLGIW